MSEITQHLREPSRNRSNGHAHTLPVSSSTQGNINPGVGGLFAPPNPLSIELGQSGLGQYGRLAGVPELKADPFSRFARSQSDARKPPPVTVKQASRAIRPPGWIVLFSKVMKDWGFSHEQAATVLGLEDPSSVGDLFSGVLSIRQRDMNDRLRSVLAIAADLDALYRNEGTIRAWLRRPQRPLGGKSPLELMKEGSMENLILVRHYVEWLAGR